MGAKYTRAQAEATKRHHEKLDAIFIRVPKGEKEAIQEHAKENYNGSVNAFINHAIWMQIQRDKATYQCGDMLDELLERNESEECPIITTKSLLEKNLPIGYTIEDGEIVVDEVAAERVKKAYDVLTNAPILSDATLLQAYKIFLGKEQ